MKNEIKAEGKTFKFEPVSSIKPEFLTCFLFANQKKQTVSITTKEFSAVCPFSGLPDIATVIIEYIPKRVCIELKSFKYYLISYRNVGVYQEEATKRIRRDLARALKTQAIKVTTIYNTRGGFDTVCTEGRL